MACYPKNDYLCTCLANLTAFSLKNDVWDVGDLHR